MKNNKLPRMVSILILTLMTIILWISLSVYRAFTIKPEAVVPQEISAPISPILDQETVVKIESGVFIDDSLIASPSASPNI